MRPARKNISTRPPAETVKAKSGDSAAVETPPGKAAALYVHVPFCVRKCRYCDFYSRPYADAAARQYLGAVLPELHRQRRHLTHPLASAYIGGGTPTSLDPELLHELLSAVRPLVGEATEFSVEANPCTLTPPIADALAACGVNRVTLGAQSFEAAELETLGRSHTADETATATRRLRRAGIGSLGLDLIYGIPGQTVESWGRSLAAALALRPAHLSCYALSFEPGTPLEADLRAGRVREMDEAEQRACYAAAIKAAGSAGLEHYELSNFARPGRRCVQNLAYWHNQAYVGVGPGAASFLNGRRWTNRPDLAAYVAALGNGRLPPAESERLTGRSAMAEALMLALRLIEGADRRAFAARYGGDPVQAFPLCLARYADLGAVIITSSHVRLAPEALFVADTILADLLAEA